nr:hypothetical protein [Tanacetum cinerariifolium]
MRLTTNHARLADSKNYLMCQDLLHLSVSLIVLMNCLWLAPFGVIDWLMHQFATLIHTNPKDNSGKSSEIVTHGDRTSLNGGISRKIISL